MKSRVACLSLFVSLVLVGCAAIGLNYGPRAKVMMKTPAESSDAARFKRVAVLPFEGMQGKEFGTEIQGLLAGVKIDDHSYFSLADRSMNDRIFSEIKLSQSSAMSRDQALKLGRLLGVKGLYTGIAGSYVSSPSSYQEQRSTCADAGGGKFLSKCKNMVNSIVNCTKNNVTYSFAAKLIDAETGQVIYARTLSESASAQSCQDDMSPPPTVPQLAGQAKQMTLNDFLQDVAPSYREVDIQLLDSSGGLDPDAQAKLSKGISFAVASRLDRACELWRDAAKGPAKSAALSYDLGVCEEAEGNIDNALQAYTQADRMLDHPDAQITQALNRVKQAKQNLAKFAAQTK